MTNPIKVYDVAVLFEEALDGINKRIAKHGSKPFHSHMEALGVVTEEYHEFIEAVRSNDHDHIRAEALDLAVAALWTLVEMEVKPL